MNYREPGSKQSPLEKYARAKNICPVRLSNFASKESGIDADHNIIACSKHNLTCPLYSTCSFRRGKMSGKCVEEWASLSHSKCVASILEPEPTRDVLFNGVNFTVSDLKALLIQIYDSADIHTLVAGQRCTEYNPDVDEYGRFIDPQCNDIRADFFHLALTNLIGVLNRTIIADISATGEVINCPVISYSSKNEPISVSLAIDVYKLHEIECPSAESCTLVLVYTCVELAMEAFVIKCYDYILELDENRDIIGGEWIKESRLDHVDFLWIAVSRPAPDVSVLNSSLKYADLVRMIRH